MEDKYFDKKLKDADVRQKLSVPTSFLQHIKDHVGKPLKVTEFPTGSVYEFVLATRKEGYMKPVFQSKGWLKFVKDTHLIAGDTIHFWKDDDGQFYIRVTKDYFARRQLAIQVELGRV
ncbi:hypothetical protein FNV43_RR13588 [Rhamnella rubrinervis]|uniref:TF-B3 domain-containing protein n=1 Tax=Rhamnella rubrinervis TaxID=2594499 RepID=A0A8K0H1G5_9ROSA|nr:hypothetical protein FNV43_RR13588 [Rhamnella rubrinervis]